MLNFGRVFYDPDWRCLTLTWRVPPEATDAKFRRGTPTPRGLGRSHVSESTHQTQAANSKARDIARGSTRAGGGGERQSWGAFLKRGMVWDEGSNQTRSKKDKVSKPGPTIWSITTLFWRSWNNRKSLEKSFQKLVSQDGPKIRMQ